jgi:hypothetical protein
LKQVYEILKEKGGPSTIREDYEPIGNSRRRIEYWKAYPGIGNKYAREIPMRSYDAHFIDDHFPIDARFRKLLKSVFSAKHVPYDTAEAFFVAVSKKLKMKCWDLDTVLFEHSAEIKRKFEELNLSARTNRAKGTARTRNTN